MPPATVIESLDVIKGRYYVSLEFGSRPALGP
jgi:hypothetical protein